MTTAATPLVDAPDEVYLDWAASTPMRPEAVEAMVAAATGCYGNPTGSHRQARSARRVVDDAREVVADALGAEPAEVIFCGCGTEADNLAIFGAQHITDGVAVCSAIEHHAVLHSVEQLGGRIVGVDAHGVIDLDALTAALDENVAIVSVMLANNETGMIQPLDDVAAAVRTHAPNALVHTDAVQAFAWLDVADLAAEADLIAISGHKFGGPKGVGALVVRNKAPITPQIIGGGQEFELRSGTHNVGGIAAMAAAAAATVAERPTMTARVAALRDRLADTLIATVPGTTETGDRSRKVAGSCHLCFDGIESEALLFLLERQGLCASAASSCAAGAQDPSHVLAAMGYSRELAAGSLRLSLGFGSTDADVDHALAAIPAAVAQLRGDG